MREVLRSGQITWFPKIQGLMGPLMLIWPICLTISDPDFSCGRMDGQAEVFHEALADLKNEHGASYTFLCKIFGAKKMFKRLWMLL